MVQVLMHSWVIRIHLPAKSSNRQNTILSTRAKFFSLSLHCTQFRIIKTKFQKQETMMRLVNLLFMLAVLCPSVNAFPYGAGSCNAGNKAASGGPHMVGTITTGTLAKGGFSVKLGATTLSPTVTSSFTVNTATTLTITGTKSFKGFIMRLGEVGGVQTDTALSGTGAVQVSSLCTGVAGVGGVTHTSKTAKTSVSASLKLKAAASSMPLDVTIVVQADNGVSEYYYSQFKISAIPAKSPTRKPSNKPSLRRTV
jgi:hypothetical protein